MEHPRHYLMQSDLRKWAFIMSEQRKPVGWLWRTAATAASWKFTDDARLVADMRALGCYEIKPVYE
jgi:hypothetical protein